MMLACSGNLLAIFGLIGAIIATAICGVILAIQDARRRWK